MTSLWITEFPTILWVTEMLTGPLFTVTLSGNPIAVYVAYVFDQIVFECRSVWAMWTLVTPFPCVDHHMEAQVLFSVATTKGFTADRTVQIQRRLQGRNARIR